MLLEDLATAPGCSVTDLTAQPYLPVNPDSTEALSTVPDIRLALNSYGPRTYPSPRTGRVPASA